MWHVCRGTTRVSAPRRLCIVASVLLCLLIELVQFSIISLFNFRWLNYFQNVSNRKISQFAANPTPNIRLHWPEYFCQKSSPYQSNVCDHNFLHSGIGLPRSDIARCEALCGFDPGHGNGTWTSDNSGISPLNPFDFCSRSHTTHFLFVIVH